MSKHGGRRSGAGRRVIIRRPMLTIGVACEEEFARRGEAAAEARYESLSKTKKFRELQAKVTKANNRFAIGERRQATWKIAPISVAAMEKTDRRSRLPAVRISRRAVLAEKAAQFGVSTGTVDRYWKLYRAWLKKSG